MIKKTVHPHGRGEHPDGQVRLAGSDGSSPRSWGTLLCRDLPNPDFRFIPTVVGNTTISLIGLVAETVHPHGRGEHNCGCSVHKSSGGSSPRSWGTRIARTGSSVINRFIPTVVGNT